MKEATVHKLRDDAGEVQIPGIDVAIIFSLPGNRQLQMRSMVLRDEGEAVQGAIIDRIMKLGDRQAARYEIHELESQLAQHEKAFANFTEDLSRVEKDHAAKKAERESQAADFRAEAERILKEGYDKWVKSGRRGEYVPQGADKHNSEIATKAAAGIRLDLEKMEAERSVTLENLTKSQERYKEEITRIKGEIEKRHAIINGA